METFSALLAICVGNSPVPGEIPTQRPVTRSFDVFFDDLRLNKRFSKQWWGWWFETPSCPLLRHGNGLVSQWWSVTHICALSLNKLMSGKCKQANILQCFSEKISMKRGKTLQRSNILPHMQGHASSKQNGIWHTTHTLIYAVEQFYRYRWVIQIPVNEKRLKIAKYRCFANWHVNTIH